VALPERETARVAVLGSLDVTYKKEAKRWERASDETDSGLHVGPEDNVADMN
jgi:hypothetical protein